MAVTFTCDVTGQSSEDAPILKVRISAEAAGLHVKKTTVLNKADNRRHYSRKIGHLSEDAFWALVAALQNGSFPAEVKQLSKEKRHGHKSKKKQKSVS